MKIRFYNLKWSYSDNEAAVRLIPYREKDDDGSLTWPLVIVSYASSMINIRASLPTASSSSTSITHWQTITYQQGRGTKGSCMRWRSDERMKILMVKCRVKYLGDSSPYTSPINPFIINDIAQWWDRWGRNHDFFYVGDMVFQGKRGTCIAFFHSLEGVGNTGRASTRCFS